MDLRTSERLVDQGVEGGIPWVTLKVRASRYTFVNGYAFLPADHPWRYMNLQSTDYGAVDIHGGITFEQYGWIGFDTNHLGDVWPGNDIPVSVTDTKNGIHWTPEMVAEEAKRLARQIAGAIDRLNAEHQEAARHVLWHIGDPRGCQPGSFTEKLLDAWARADLSNSTRLGHAFPILDEAVILAKQEGADAVAKWGGIQ